MPVLKEYADSNDKDGYYIHAPISGVSHPIPLQTPEVTEKIYRELGYQPIKKGPDGGVNVPNELIWTLHNVGLHWTENSGPQGEPADLDLDRLRKKGGPELTENDIKTILSYADEYKGQYQSRVKELQAELSEKPATSTGGSSVITVEELMEDLSDEPSFSDEVEEKLDQWEPQTIVDDDHEPENEFDGFFATPRSKHRETFASVPNLKQRLQEYEDHSCRVDHVRGEKTNIDDNSSALKISFHADNHSELKGWAVTDYRGTGDERDFEISTSADTRNFRFEITDNYISDFNTGVSHQSTGKFDLPPDDFWGYEIENQDPNEIMHALVSDFSHVVLVLSEFFDKFPSYNLDSMGMGNHSVYLP